MIEKIWIIKNENENQTTFQYLNELISKFTIEIGLLHPK